MVAAKTPRSRKLLSVKQVAQRYGISPRTVWRYEAAGVIPAAKRLGPRLVRFVEGDLDEADDSLPPALRHQEGAVA